MAAEFETPELRDIPVNPRLQPGAMAHSKPFIAAPEHQESLGYPGKLIDDWHDVAVSKLGDLGAGAHTLKEALDHGVHCRAASH